MPVYAEFFRWLGWADAIDPVYDAWHAGDRQRALDLIPEELVKEIFLFGTADEMRERMGEFAEGGITTFVLSTLTEPDKLPGLIDALAPPR